MLSRRGLLASAVGAGLAPLGIARRAHAADKPSQIRIDWATYNPVSMVLKDKGLLEKEFAKDGIGVRWVQSLGSNKALEFLNAGSIDFGSTAGSAALLGRINGNPIKSIYVYSKPEWTALVTRKDTSINKIADLKGKRVAVTRGTDPHIFLVRALLSVGMTEKDISEVLLQHPDGKTALIRGDVDAWAGLDPMMAAAQVEDGARLFYRNKDANTYGILNSTRGLPQNLSRADHAACSRSTKRRANIASANYDDEKRVFMGVTKLPDAVVDIQLKERTDLTYSRIGPPQRDTILQAGLALQQAGVIPGNVDVKKRSTISSTTVSSPRRKGKFALSSRIAFCACHHVCCRHDHRRGRQPGAAAVRKKPLGAPGVAGARPRSASHAGAGLGNHRAHGLGERAAWRRRPPSSSRPSWTLHAPETCSAIRS